MEAVRLVVLVAVAGVLSVDSRGAGRAFPIDAENYAVEAFQQINRDIEWDYSNFLVDLSGNFANCKSIGINGFVDVDAMTQDGVRIGGYVDDTSGSENHVDAVIEYANEIIDKWTGDSRSDVYQQILRAESVGCSVRPGCNGRVAVACLFSPEYRGGHRPPNIEEGAQDALAFTKEQYNVAETAVGGKWDQDHFLENLSGYETSCAMVLERTWAWAYATTQANKRGREIVGLYGAAPNRGQTEPAMVEILEGMKSVKSVGVGCSIIPDCILTESGRAEMWVVVGCVFEI